MLAVYIFSLVAGGGFLAVSLLGDVFGGHADVDFDGDAVGDVGSDVDAHVEGHASHAAKIFSIRTLVYGLFGFGAVGTTLSLLGSGGLLVTAGFATAGGVLSGGLVTTLFNWLYATESGAQQEDDGFVGLPGVVTLPISTRAPGTVAVERGGRRVSLRALPHGSTEGDAGDWRSVVVVEMNEGIARVAPIAGELTASPGEDEG